MISSPPESFVARPLQPGDAAAAAGLLADFDAAHLDEVTDRLSEQDLLDWWRMYELGRESVAVCDDRLAAFGLLGEREEGVVELQAFVHPDLVGRGLGSFLLDWAEDEGRQRGERLRTVIVASDDPGRRLVESRDYREVRHSYRMLIDLEAPPAKVEWPDGYAVATLRDGEKRLLYEVLEEAFAEEWGRPHRSFEDWERNIFSQESFDPALCFLVREGDEVVAAETCALRFGMGFIGSVGVLEPWRRRGLGRALLLHGFAELYQRGERRISLGVDACNPTGATKLYEAVGMRVVWQADTYEKAL